MNRNEKTLLLIAVLLFAVLLVVRVVPLVTGYYRQGREEVALLEERIARLQALSAATAEWQERARLKEAEVADLAGWVFPGNDPNLVSSSVQRALRQVVEGSNVSLRETGVARYSRVGQWLRVEQDADFSLGQEAMLPFLAALEAQRPRLQVAAFSLSRNRRQYTGSLTVVGFARSEPAATGGSAVGGSTAAAVGRAAASVGPGLAEATSRAASPAGDAP